MGDLVTIAEVEGPKADISVKSPENPNVSRLTTVKMVRNIAPYALNAIRFTLYAIK
jgi:hypothetical protein